MLKRYLLAPGPTQVPPEVLLAMAHPMIHHRAPESPPCLGKSVTDSSGSFRPRRRFSRWYPAEPAAWRRRSRIFVSRRQGALCNGGKFGERWGKLCQTFGVQATEIKVEWGQAVDPQAIADALKRDASIKAVYVQASETSTGVAHDTRAIAEIVRNREQTILVVDAITALGVFDLKTDEWGIDVLVARSQKALMLPPGLAFVSVSEKAWRLADKAKNAAFYFNLKKERDGAERTRQPTRPACL